MSQSSCILVINRKHRRSVFGTDRTGAGIMLSKPTLSGREERARSRGGGGWGRAHRQGSGPLFFAFSVSSGRPGGMDGSLRVSETDPRLRTLATHRPPERPHGSCHVPLLRSPPVRPPVRPRGSCHVPRSPVATGKAPLPNRTRDNTDRPYVRKAGNMVGSARRPKPVGEL